MSAPLNRVFDSLKSEASSRNIDVHPSFFVELQNYSRHVHVDQLEEEKLAQVIQGLGTAALEKADDRVGGGAVRSVITEICHDPFTDCSNAARNILGE